MSSTMMIEVAARKRRSDFLGAVGGRCLSAVGTGLGDIRVHHWRTCLAERKSSGGGDCPSPDSHLCLKEDPSPRHRLDLLAFIVEDNASTARLAGGTHPPVEGR